MAYVEAFMAAVPTENKEKFIEFCKIAGPVFKKYGALEVVDCWGADIPDGTTTSFPLAVKLQENETVALAWTIWPDKATRDEAAKHYMDDPSFKDLSMPFDEKRAVLGCFEKLEY
ncbi:MAG: DUF1428 domain-containing protein [Gammaproteobacteria bacterium]|nr:DUF1428 domain-containing protein [Gammaproteobacteria bacterium]